MSVFKCEILTYYEFKTGILPEKVKNQILIYAKKTKVFIMVRLKYSVRDTRVDLYVVYPTTKKH